jgi:hypothetical protein
MKCMKHQSLLAIGTVLAAVAAGTVNAKPETEKPKVGDTIYLELKGEPAREYAGLRGLNAPPLESAPELQVEISGTVDELQPDGKYRIEHQTTVKVGYTNAKRKVTLTAIVDPIDIITDVTPKNTAVASYPGGKPSMTKSEEQSWRLTISKFDGLKLETKTSAEVFGSPE